MADSLPAAVGIIESDGYSDLNKLVKEFEKWQKDTEEVYRENNNLCLQLKTIEKKCELLNKSEKYLMDDNSKLNNIIKGLHNILAKRCNYEEDNNQLREQLTTLHKEITNIQEHHEQQMISATNNITILQETHHKELVKTHETITQQMRKEVQLLHSIITNKDDEIKQLQQSLSEMEKGKHTETVKLRLEYDAKLLKLQKQSIKSQTTRQSSTNSDIYRQKLQAIRVEHDKEILILKRKVTELEGKLSFVNKRRKI